MRTQEEIRKTYQEELKKVWDKEMQEYCDKKAQYLIELEDGRIIEIEKPSIETSFCFGYGQNGISDEEDEKRADNMSDYARKSEEYFMKENLEEINDRINDLKKAKEEDGYVFATNRRYDNGNKEASYYVYEYKGRYEQDKWKYEKYLPKELTENEINEIIKGLETVKEHFTKRLKTYLKRYGLTKIHSWSYLVD